jgi:hypothetical protein
VLDRLDAPNYARRPFYLKLSRNLSTNRDVIFGRSLTDGTLLATMLISHFDLCMCPCSSSVLVEMKPVQLVAATSLFREEHKCSLPSQALLGLL